MFKAMSDGVSGSFSNKNFRLLAYSRQTSAVDINSKGAMIICNSSAKLISTVACGRH
jgi:hypothetical protein